MISERKIYGQYELGNRIYQAYIDKHGDTIVSPKTKRTSKLTKTKFGRHCGFANWSDFDAYCINAKLVELPKALMQVDTAIAEIAKPYIFDLLTSQKQSVGDMLAVQQVMGDLSQSDLDHFLAHKYENLPISLKNALDGLFKTTSIKDRLRIDQDDAQYIYLRVWDQLAQTDKFTVLSELKFKLKLMEFHHFTPLWNEVNEYLSDKSNDVNWGCIDRDYLSGIRFLVAEAVKKKLVSIDELISIHSAFVGERTYMSRGECLFGTDGEMTGTKAFLWLFEGVDKVSEDDKKALQFYDNYCRPADLTGKPQHSSLFYPYGDTQESLESIEHMLRSKSDLAAPVLATYMLYNNGSNKISIERLYAIFYYLLKFDQLHPLVEKLELLAKIEKDLSYCEDDLKSELIAATVLTRNASSIATGTKEQFDNYFDLLINIVKAGHYGLALREYARFIELCKLEFKPNAFKEILDVCLQHIDYQELLSLSQQDKNGVYLLGTLLSSDVEKLEPLVPDALKEQASIFKDDNLLRILSLRSGRGRSDDLEHRIKATVTALGCPLDHYTQIPGVGRTVLYSDSIESRLADIMRLARPTTEKDKSSRLKLNKRMATLMKEDEHEYRFRHGRRGPQTTLVVSSDEVNMPVKMKKVYEKLKNGVNNNFLYSKEVLVRLHMAGVEPKHIVECGAYWFAVNIDDCLYLCGDVESQQDLTSLLFKYRPKKAIRIDYESLHHSSYVSDEFPNGYIHSRENIIEFQDMESWEEADIQRIYDVFSELDIKQYSGKNPLEMLSKRLAPKFEFHGVEFNTDGTDYFS